MTYIVAYMDDENDVSRAIKVELWIDVRSIVVVWVVVKIDSSQAH